jgi:hypothetical protein
VDWSGQPFVGPQTLRGLTGHGCRLPSEPFSFSIAVGTSDSIGQSKEPGVERDGCIRGSERTMQFHENAWLGYHRRMDSGSKFSTLGHRLGLALFCLAAFEACIWFG